MWTKVSCRVFFTQSVVINIIVVRSHTLLRNLDTRCGPPGVWPDTQSGSLLVSSSVMSPSSVAEAGDVSVNVALSTSAGGVTWGGFVYVAACRCAVTIDRAWMLGFVWSTETVSTRSLLWHYHWVMYNVHVYFMTHLKHPGERFNQYTSVVQECLKLEVEEQAWGNKLSKVTFKCHQQSHVTLMTLNKTFLQLEHVH